MKKIILATTLFIAVLYSDGQVKNVNGAFGVQFGDYGKDYVINKFKFNYGWGIIYNFTAHVAEADPKVWATFNKKLPKVVDSLEKYSVHSTQLSDRIYWLSGEGKVFKKNEHACKYYTNLYEEVLVKKYNLSFQKELDEELFIYYKFIAISKNNVEIKITCSSSLKDTEHAKLSITYRDKQLSDQNKKEIEEEKRMKKKESENSLNYL